MFTSIHQPLSAGLKQRAGALLLVAATVAVLALPAQQARANHQPADKIAVSASTLQAATVGLTAGSVSNSVKLLSATLRASSPTDLVLQFTAECALQTDVKTSGNGDSTAIAAQNVWVTIDGNAVPVSSIPNADNGKVTLCDREFRLTTTDFDDVDASIAIYQKTKQANGFNWVALNVGSGVHTIEVWTEASASVTGNGEARAYVGKRTLVVEPAKLANDASF